MANGQEFGHQSLGGAPAGSGPAEACAANRPLPPFMKYFQGEWSQPGLGGKSSNVLDASSRFAGAPQVAYNSHLRQYLAFLDDTSHISYSTSDDGIKWSKARLLKSADSAIYATPLAPGNEPNKLGKKFFVFYVHSPHRWMTATLNRLTVEVEVK
jgi:hypothetical protein